MTPGCVKAASDILQNMDESVDPCEDFYQFACGGFIKKTIIPDDRTRMSSFSVLSDELLLQVRMLLEEESPSGEAKPFRMARDLYKSCMDIQKIEALGLEPIKQILNDLGGWPVLLGPGQAWAWDDGSYIWYEQVYKFREFGYSVDYLVDFSVTTDLKNSSWRVLDIDQPGLGMSREYLIKGLEDEDVQVMKFLKIEFPGSSIYLAQWIFSGIFVFVRKTFHVKIIGRKNDILSEIIKNCWSKIINN